MHRTQAGLSLFSGAANIAWNLSSRIPNVAGRTMTPSWAPGPLPRSWERSKPLSDYRDGLNHCALAAIGRPSKPCWMGVSPFPISRKTGSDRCADSGTSWPRADAKTCRNMGIRGRPVHECGILPTHGIANSAKISPQR